VRGDTCGAYVQVDLAEAAQSARGVATGKLGV